MGAFVDFKLTLTANIDNTGLLVFQSDRTCVLDSIWLSNTTIDNIFIDLKVISERLVDDSTVVTEAYHTKNRLLEGSTNEELLKGSILYLEPNDVMYANSDFSANTFDCLISYRELKEA